MAGTDLPGGVYINPIPPSLGSEVKIEYNGILSQKSNDSISICIGYGFIDKPFNQKEIQMQKSHNGFIANFPIDAPDTLNFYFKDSQGNIDDNKGEKWGVAVDTENLSYA
ncbi:MAG: hypothetical protein GX808_09970 [Syntrophomonadaceae bacterium]|nr:hypothetical protein [Syntrophomonadaceae bacterium]